MAKYGMHLGTAFQLIDDVLDYSASSEEMGKNIGDDLAEGKPTLPLIYTIQNGTKEQANIVRKAIEENGLEYIDAVTRAIQATGAIDYTANCAEKESQLAISALENVAESGYKTALIDLARFAVHRKF